METSAYIAIYMVLISSAFSIAFLTWLGYTILAPWYRSAMGRLQWFLWLALWLILFVPFLQINFGNEIPFRREISVGAMFLFNVVLLFCGIGIYNLQIKGYLKRTRKEVK